MFKLSDTKRVLTQTKSFWTGLGTLISTGLALFEVTDKRITGVIALGLGFATMIFAKDTDLQVENQVKELSTKVDNSINPIK